MKTGAAWAAVERRPCGVGRGGCGARWGAGVLAAFVTMIAVWTGMVAFMKKRDAPHLPVLFDQVLEVIDPKPGQVIVDCTLGLGGHSSAMLERPKPDGRLVGIDLDPANIRMARVRLEKTKGKSGRVALKAARGLQCVLRPLPMRRPTH